MANRFSVPQLQPGDVLLYRGTSLVSRLIQFFDGSPLSHAALYLGGGRVGEAVAQGLVERTTHASFHENEWVRAYRLTPTPGSMDPVVATGRRYLAQGNRYGYEQLMLLALLCSTRKLDITPVLRRLLRTLLDTASTALTALLKAGREPMICSEFVFRAFDEAEKPISDRFSIKIPGMLPLPTEDKGTEEAAKVPVRGAHPESLVALFSATAGLVEAPPAPTPDPATLDDLMLAYLHEVEGGPKKALPKAAVDQDDLREATDRFALAVYSARPGRAETMAGGEEAAEPDAATELPTAYQYLHRAAPDFVTPADLFNSPSLQALWDVYSAA